MTEDALAAWEQGRRRPRGSAWAMLLAAAEGDGSAELREARVAELERRALEGLDLWTGLPAAAARPVLELLLEDGGELLEELGDQAAWLDRRELADESRAAARAAHRRALRADRAAGAGGGPGLEDVDEDDDQDLDDELGAGRDRGDDQGGGGLGGVLRSLLGGR